MVEHSKADQDKATWRGLFKTYKRYERFVISRSFQNTCVNRQSYLSMLLKEVGTNSKAELRTLMRDRDIWRGLSGVDRT